LIGAAVKESVLEPGAVPDRRRTLHARIAMTIGAVVLALTLLGGRAWWNAVDAAYRTACTSRSTPPQPCGRPGGRGAGCCDSPSTTRRGRAPNGSGRHSSPTTAT